MTLPTISSDATEGDVETQVVLPILSRSDMLGIRLANIKSKEFLASFDIGKGSKSKKGYIPDYCVYFLAMPVAAIEVKSPSVSVNDAWEEASLYAHALNKRYPSKTNPCEIIFATNGIDVLAGNWDDSTPKIQGKISDIVVGSALLRDLQELMGYESLIHNYRL